MAKNSVAATKKGNVTASSKKKSIARNLHVVLHAEGWVIRSEGSTRASSLHNTQREAVEAARTLAKRNKITLVIHYRDGRVKERDSYNRDPMPPREPRKVLYPTTPPRTATKDAIKRAVSAAINEAATNKELKKVKASNHVARGSKSQRQSKAI